MHEPNDLYKISKKTVYRVLIVHFVFIIFLALQFNPFKKNIKHKLTVNHIIHQNEIFIPKDVSIKTTSQPKQTTSVTSKVKEKKQVVKKIDKPKIDTKAKTLPAKIATNKINDKKADKIIPKENAIKANNYSNLITTLEKQINEIETPIVTEHTEEDLIIPQNIKTLNVDKILESIEDQSPYTLKDLLVKELQDNLNLPEFGAVKVSFTILPTGEIKDVEIIDHESYENQKYLKNSLRELSFKSIKKMFDEPQKFIVTFRNQ